MYRIYWMDGFTEAIIGFSIEDALEKAGYGSQALNVIAHYHTGHEIRFRWDGRNKTWI